MNQLQNLLLLGMRAFWGYKFFQTGMGKVQDIPWVTRFFTDLNIPYPALNAYVASYTEFIGGFCLMVGLGGRVVTIPLSIAMIVAYLTADKEAVEKIFVDTDKFLHAEPFLFLLTSLIVLFFGPGKISLDYLISKFCCKSCKN
ncbi:MAG: DoxX family protein [Proteobacteria bacterium]|nr:DoxX family protein [Pseudomonadota bacterium]